MVVPHLRCRTQRFEFVCVEVDVQPDREDAERDDAAVEVAAHRFFVSLSRGLSSKALARRSSWSRFSCYSSASAVCRRCGQD